MSDQSETTPVARESFHDKFPRTLQMDGFLGQIFNFFSSFYLAILFLSLILIVVAIATIFESQHDADYAHYMVYRTKWFEGLLLLLCVNIIVAAFSRWPWKARHTGFLITHLGLITTLAGAAVSRYGGYEGQLALMEGETGRQCRTKTQLVRVQEGDNEYLFDVEIKYDEPTESDQLKLQAGPYKIHIDKYYPNAAMQDVVTSGGEVENPAVKLWLTTPAGLTDLWLLSRDEKKSRHNLGPAVIQFVEADSQEALEGLMKKPDAESPDKGKLIISLSNGENLEIDVGKYQGKPYDLGEGKGVLTVLEHHEQAEGTDNVVPGGPDANPAVFFEIKSNSMPNVGKGDWLFYYSPYRRSQQWAGFANIELRLATTEQERTGWLNPEPFLEKHPKGLLTFMYKGERKEFSIDRYLNKKFELESGLEMEILGFYRAGKLTGAQIQEGAQDDKDYRNPVVEYHLSGADGVEHHTVFSLFPTFDRVSTRKSKHYVQQSQLFLPVVQGSHLVLVAGPGDQLAYQCSSEKHPRVSGQIKIGEPAKTNWMDFELLIQKFHPQAVNQIKLTEHTHSNNSDPHGDNHTGHGSPAVKVEFEKDGVRRTYFAFADEQYRSLDTFPFGADHGIGLRLLQYEVETKKQGKQSSLRIIKGPDGKLHYTVDQPSKGAFESGKIDLKSDINLPWMPGARFSVEEFIVHGAVSQEVVAGGAATMGKQHFPAVHAKVIHGTDTKDGWIWWGTRHGTEFEVGDKKVNIALYYDTFDLDFDVHLVDFRDVHNPGGDGIASFESDVDILDEKAGLKKGVMIHMNFPLEYNKHMLFQSSYVKSDRPGGKDISIFSVSYDPGIQIVYTGFSLVCCGIVTMFYIRPSGRRRKQKNQNKKAS
ncbi:MAG: hypothetical protein O3B01_16555 [Planctomycetota bacterium]|nr:hypothetical protein [Planctomycetota bacterium]